MKYKKIIKRILFEGSHQISAVLPKALDPVKSLNSFVYKIPIILNKSYFIKNQDTKAVDYFKIIFYKNESFSNDFNSNFFTDTKDFKKFSVDNDNNSNTIFSENLKNITKGFYQDGSVDNDHYSVNFKESSIADRDLYVYNITLSNAISQEIKNEMYSCIRIFAIKNYNIVDDTGFVFFEDDNFLETVYDTKKLYDLQYFINEVYLEGFANSLNIGLPSNADATNRSLAVIKSSQFDTSIISGDVNITVDFESVTPVESVSQSMNISAFSTNSMIDIGSSNFFEKIVRLYLSNSDIFVFRIQCQFTISDEGTSTTHIFEKQRSFDRSHAFITRVVSAYRATYINNLFNQCNFQIDASANSNYIEVVLKADSLIENRSLLTLFKVDSIKKNNITYSDGELYSSSNLSINDKINFIDLDLHELTLNNNNIFKFYIPNDSLSLIVRLQIKITSRDIERTIKSELAIINPDYENLFNKLNKRLSNSIRVESNGLNRNAYRDDFFTSYNSIKINNVKSRFGDIAYNFGYFNQQDSQNTQSTSNILEFFKSAIFSFELEESLQNIVNAKFKKKIYFFGNQIIENETIQEDSININNSLLFSRLKISISEILSDAVIKGNDSLNVLKVISSFGQEFNENDRIPANVFNFLSENNFYLNKSIKIKIVPIPKLIKIYQTQADLDQNLNITFPSEVPDDIKNSVNINFVDLFYDKNSSFNWNKFLSFKKLYFKKDRNSNETISNASYLAPIWDYLSSSIYIKASNSFIKRETFTKNDVENVILSGNAGRFDDDNYNTSDALADKMELNDIITKSFFESYSSKYFNFQINDNNFINIENTGMIVTFRNLDASLTQPKDIEIISTNLNKEKRIDLDITKLRDYFSTQDITRMKFFAKLSIHPLIRNENYSMLPNIEFTRFTNTVLNTSEQFYITQSRKYMSGDLSKYFFEFNNPINNDNATVYESGELLKLSLFTGNNRKNVSSLTFKELFDFCISNNTTILQDFYLRVGFTFEINNKYYYTNVYKKLNRNNLKDSLVEINRVESIKEL